jgi:ABC-type transporter Mla maintaining outer membrane lipid asymmetry ATPase subunit MlaF
MRKRVAIARALAVNSDLILYDSRPRSSIRCSPRKWQLIREFKTIGVPQVVVTHNIPLAGEVADHRALRRGEIVDYGNWKEFSTASILRRASSCAPHGS